ncbi:hypothetical protein LXL04_022476 [Taraxacum kok-saghyz]
MILGSNLNLFMNASWFNKSDAWPQFTACNGAVDNEDDNLIRRIWLVFGPEEVNERAYAFEVVSGYDGTGITETVNWLVDVMERSKQTKMLRVRAGIDVISYH